MQQLRKIHQVEKHGWHPRNLHRERYDFQRLMLCCPELSEFVKVNSYGDESIDFFNPTAVKCLNKALLTCFYGIGYWDIPAGYLCPPIPGRADYIHHVADLLSNGAENIPSGLLVHCLDIGVGANCIFPIIGNRSYGWSFVGSDIDPLAVENANRIVKKNPVLENNIEIRLQKNENNIFTGIMHPCEHFDLVFCNPPFYGSASEAETGSRRKVSNLKGIPNHPVVANFGGRHNELWCHGGEVQFVRQMILQSKQLPRASTWFTALIAKSEHLSPIYQTLNSVNANEIRTIPMAHGNKKSRIVAWNFSLEDTQRPAKSEKS